MEFRVNREILRGAVAVCSRIARATDKDVRAHVLIQAMGKHGLCISASDYSDVWATSEIPSINSVALGGFTLDARNLNDVLHRADSEDVVFSWCGGNTTVELVADETTYLLHRGEAKDAPAVPEHHGLDFTVLDALTVSSMLEAVMYAVCKDESRTFINGVLIESDGACVRMVATDGHRLARVERPLIGVPSIRSIVPEVGGREAKRLLDTMLEEHEDATARALLAGLTTEPLTVAIAFRGPFLFLLCGRGAAQPAVILVIKLRDLAFPPWRDVVPKSHRHEVRLDRKAFLAALTRLGPVKAQGVKLTVAGSALCLYAERYEFGEARCQVLCETTGGDGTGDGTEIGFDPQYLVEVLTRLPGDTVTIEFNEPLDPGVFRVPGDDSYLCVLMPMRVS